MPNQPQVFEHLGPYINHPPVAAFGSISARAFELYHDASGGHEREKETPTQHLVTRMMYVAEATSTALRLNASWALSHPALSLLRDRYEQVVRFSWLARQSNNSEMVKYVAYFYGKASSLYQSLPQAAKDELAKMPFATKVWAKEKPTKKQRDYLNRWSALDLKSMAMKRDKLKPVSACSVAHEKLADLYTSIYAQFSSVTHYDMYSMNILGLHKSPTGELVLAADPQFPSIINLHNALFDLVQCFEVTRRFIGADFDNKFSALHDEWRGFVGRVIGP